jgi:chromosome partitioning protein
MQVVTLLNEKGGVGKTTLSVHIAAGLAMKGKRVLVIDADAQANATSQLRVPENNGLYSLLVQDGEWNEVLWKSPAVEGELLVVPSNLETRVIPMLVDDAALLRERLGELDGFVDVVVIDTSPTPSMLHSMIYMATDYMVYPTQCELLAMEGLAKSIQHMTKLNNNRRALGLPDAELLGIQPTMYDVRTNAHDYGLGLIVGEFKRKTFPALPVRTVWRDAAFAQKTVFQYAPEHIASVEAWAMVDRVMKGMAS